MKPEIYFAPDGCSVRVLGGSGNVLGVITWNAETQARFTPEEAVLRAAELNAAAGWSEPCVVNGVEIDVAGVVPHAGEVKSGLDERLITLTHSELKAKANAWMQKRQVITDDGDVHPQCQAEFAKLLAFIDSLATPPAPEPVAESEPVVSGEPVSLFEAAGRPPGTVSRIHQYDAAACCRRFDELERQLAEVREQRDEVMSYLRATQRQLAHTNAERNRLAEALHEVIEGRHGAFVRAKAALAAVEGGGK